jgi:ABC-type lipoprotein export system ATPase subunit
VSAFATHDDAATSPTAALQPLVRCRRVARTFGTGASAVVAIHDVDCAVQPGQQIVLIGPSGSGKSTLLHILAGLDAPTSGEVSWPAIGSRDRLRPGPVGIVFQGPSLLAPLDVVENVMLPLLLEGIDRRAAAIRAHDALALLDLDGLAAKLPEELSGGQAQRVATARMLASRPRLILADEPTGQLDHITGEHVVSALIATAESTGAGLVVNSHDPAVAERFAFRWTMRDGRLDRDNDEHDNGNNTSDGAKTCSV